MIPVESGLRGMDIVTFLDPGSGDVVELGEFDAWERLAATDEPVVLAGGHLSRTSGLLLSTLAEMRLDGALARSPRGSAADADLGTRNDAVGEARERLARVHRAWARAERLAAGHPA